MPLENGNINKHNNDGFSFFSFNVCLDVSSSRLRLLMGSIGSERYDGRENNGIGSSIWWQKTTSGEARWRQQWQLYAGNNGHI